MPKPIEVLRTICSVPGTDEPLEFDEDRNACSASGRRFRSVRGVPVLRDETRPVRIQPKSHLSGGIAQDRVDYMCGLAGYTLLLGGGNTTFTSPNVIEVEFDVFNNTDVAADAHALPFRSDTFDLFFAMNVFEHLHQPFVAAREALRVLKPGGELHVHTAFLQPLHEDPVHFYNATEFGARGWFRDFDELECTVSPNFNPLYAVSWLSHELLSAVAQHLGGDAAGSVGVLTLEELARFWQRSEGWNPKAHEIFMRIPERAQRRIAAGFDVRGRKPSSQSGSRMSTII